jgi:hypothetical protein
MNTVPIRKYPTRLLVKCGKCLHRGAAVAFIDKPPRLKCSRCGSRAAVIISRDVVAERQPLRRGAAGKRVTMH